ncbi:Hypothetical protein AJF4211_000970 [Avibacterium paragallinarum JF4211]|nr:Hypothetical protein AJF4211_000970 [Avibacterium paragallinarum JF4211]
MERAIAINAEWTPKAQKSGVKFHRFSNAQAKGQGQEIIFGEMHDVFRVFYCLIV